jgi:hypothetical protein
MAGLRRSGFKKPLLRQRTGNDSCELIDPDDAFYLFSDRFPKVFTLIDRKDDRTLHLKLCHWISPQGRPIRVTSPSLKSG